MKFILKNKISGYSALSWKEKRAMRRNADKQSPMGVNILIGLVIGTIFGLSSRFFEDSLGYGAAIGIAVVITLSLAFLYNSIVINPRIEQLLKKQPNKSSEPTRTTPADEDNL